MSTEYTIPEINEAVRLAGRIAFALEDEYHPLDWETRLDLARDAREIAAEVEGRARSLAESVEFILESEIADLSDWEERLQAAGLCRAAAAEIQREVRDRTLRAGASAPSRNNSCVSRTG